MKRSRQKAIEGFFLAALICSPLLGSIPPQPGTVNYIEGQATIGAQTLTEKSIGSVKLSAGQALSTVNGRAEILLPPGIFLRVGENSSLQMNSPGLADTITTLQKGRAMVEVAEIRPENNVRIAENNSSVQLLKPGLYDFDSDHGLIRVFDGKVVVEAEGQRIQVKSGHQLNLNTVGKLKPQKFDKKAYTDDFYRWASLRSSYLAEANVDSARTYTGGVGWSPTTWYGDGWYWNPGFNAYTFIPGDGIFLDPFGWGFYSPWMAFEAPYWGYGYRYGFVRGGYRRFGTGYRPHYAPGSLGFGRVGHAASIGRGIGGSSSGGSFGNGSLRGSGGVFHGGNGGGVRSGGGFHGGGRR
jgi:hypothetical protein